MPGDKLVLFGKGGAIWGIVEVTGEEVERLTSYGSRPEWTAKCKWALGVQWKLVNLESGNAKSQFAKLRENGLNPPRAFSREITAADAKKISTLLAK